VAGSGWLYKLAAVQNVAVRDGGCTKRLGIRCEGLGIRDYGSPYVSGHRPAVGSCGGECFLRARRPCIPPAEAIAEHGPRESTGSFALGECDFAGNPSRLSCALYRGTSLERTQHPAGRFCRTMPGVIRRSEGGGRFLMGEVPLYTLCLSIKW
jgi:hypothetical protein